MSRPQEAGYTGGPLQSERLHSTRKRFEAAWRLALEGAPEPELASYLEGHSEPERLTLRGELLAIDREYRSRRIQQGSSIVGGCTIDLSSNSAPASSLSDTTKAQAGIT